EVLTRLKRNRDFMVTLVVETINEVIGDLRKSTTVASNNPVFPDKDWGHTVKKKRVQGLDKVSIHRWVTSAINSSVGPIDLMTRHNYPGSAEAKKWIESIGEYGSKVDPGNKPIFEFRDLRSARLVDLPADISNLLTYLNS